MDSARSAGRAAWCAGPPVDLSLRLILVGAEDILSDGHFVVGPPVLVETRGVEFPEIIGRTLGLALVNVGIDLGTVDMHRSSCRDLMSADDLVRSGEITALLHPRAQGKISCRIEQTFPLLSRNQNRVDPGLRQSGVTENSRTETVLPKQGPTEGADSMPE